MRQARAWGNDRSLRKAKPFGVVGAVGCRASVAGGEGRGPRQPRDLIQRLDSLLLLESRTMETSVSRESVLYFPGTTELVLGVTSYVLW